MKALVICDEFYHPGSVVKDGLEFLANECSFDYIMDMTQFDVMVIDDYDVLVLCKSNSVSPDNKDVWMTAEVLHKFTEFVENGGGFFVIHAGTVGCMKEPLLKALVGCSFINHPEQCAVTHTPVSGHEIVRGVNSFVEKDEHYFIDFTADDAEIILESESEHGKQIAGYVRSQGSGRVCVLTPGHNLSVWQNAEYMKILRNALMWCSRLEI